MYRWILALLAIIFLMLSSSGAGMSSPAAPAARGNFAPDEVLVKFRPDVNPGVFARSIGASVRSRIDALDVHILRVNAGTVEAVVRALSGNPLVEYAEPNFVVTAVVIPNDTYYSAQWAWSVVKAPEAWDMTTVASVRVAVVDTGIDNDHPDLPKVAAQRDFANNDNNAEDDDGHGTHVAGTIGARTNNGTGVAGANWTVVSLVAAKVLDATGSGYLSWVANGITWAADNGAKVINLSLGSYFPSSTLKNAVNYAWNKGAVLACAAGNDGMNWKLYPAAYPNCIAVAATDQSDNKAWFSNYGASWVDVAAPGVAILSTMPNSPVYLNTQYGYKTDYDSLNGTSMATPHVAGLAALVWASGKCSSPTCVRSRIENNADAISGTGSYWKKGRVNYYRAVSAP